LILLTGASGLLGANLAIAAQERYQSLISVSHNHVLNSRDQVRADLTDKETVTELIQCFNPTWVIHCAALTDVDWCEKYPDEAWRVNVEMSHHLAVAARRVRAGIIYISTDSVFDGETGQYSEKDAPKPLNMYARSKLAGEIAVQKELEHSLIIRTNIYGWNMQDKLSLAEWILSQLEAGQHINAFCDVIFTPILVNDLCEVIFNMLEHGLSGLYHVAGADPCSKYEFAMHLTDIFGLDHRLVQPVSIASSHLQAPRPKNTSLQTTKVCRALGSLMPDVRSGLKRLKELRESGFVRKLKGLG
jgi:dTDP-4-dehydrorhamnose reductase